MRYTILLAFLFSVLFTNCTSDKKSDLAHVSVSLDVELDIPDTTVSDTLLDYDHNRSIWTLDDQLFSGYAVQLYPNGNLKEKFGVLNGKKQNQAIHLFPDGHFKHVMHYQQGKLHGVKKTWSSDKTHILISELNYHTGKVHGTQRLWYTSGELYKKLNMNMGREEGLQQAFRKNGDLYANYEARAGRIFGLKKAALCFGLENENIQYEN